MYKLVLIAFLSSLNLFAISVLIECDITEESAATKVILDPNVGYLRAMNESGKNVYEAKGLTIDKEKGYFSARDESGLLIIAFKFDEEGGLYINDDLVEINNCIEKTTIDTLGR